MGGMLVVMLLAAAGSPVPAAPQAKPPAGADRTQSYALASLVHRMTEPVVAHYVREVAVRDLFAGAVRGLHEEAGAAVPDEVTAALRAASTTTELVEILAAARVRLGNHPNLAGSRSLVAALNGFRHATDPTCGVVAYRPSGSFSSIEQDFGLGVELEGVGGLRWAVYQVEQKIATNRAAPAPYFGPIPAPGTVPSPAEFPWRVRRVVPNSPAQKAGVRPGDVITHLNKAEVTSANADQLFSELVSPRPAVDPQTGQLVPTARTLTLRRGDGKPVTAELKADGYTPECVFGVARAADDRWDCMLDRQSRIGYIRIGPIEDKANEVVAGMLADLVKRGCRGVVLDLRWCPGGYVDPGVLTAALFLKPGSIVADLNYRNPPPTATVGKYKVPNTAGAGAYADLPLVVLIGPETGGGGEMIAAALRHHDPEGKRVAFVGQRTAGRGGVTTTRTTGFLDLQFRFTSGTSLRPDGSPRHKTPESRPTDDWGVRPTPGLEVPLTADALAELRRQAEAHALRPADGREALPWDDPAADPHRLAALAYLRKKLDPGSGK